MPVYKAKNGTWFFKCSLNGRQFLRRGFSSRREALEAEVLLKSENRAKTKYKREMTFYALIHHYKNYIKVKVKPTTHYDLCCRIDKYILKNFPNIPVGKLTMRHFDCFRKALSQSSLKSKNKILNILEAIFDYLNIYFGIDIPYAKRLPKFKNYYPEEIDKDPVNKPVEFNLLKKYYAASNDYFKFYLLTSYIFGLRISEARGLKVKAFDRDRKTLNIYQVTTSKCGIKKSLDLIPKSSASNRKYYLSDRYILYFQNYVKAHQLKETDRLFFGLKKMNPISESSIRRYLSQIEETHHLEHITPHGLRHGIASYLYAEGISFEDIGKYLGHKFHSVTMDVYIDMTKERQRAITDKIDHLIERLDPGE